MTGPIWLLIGAAVGAAGTGAWLAVRALKAAFRNAFADLATRIDAVLEAEEPEPDEHVEDDVWDRDLRQLLTDSID